MINHDKEHADGTVTTDTSTPFCFSDQHRDELAVLQLRLALPPPIKQELVKISSEGRSVQEVAALLVATLQRDGAVVMEDAEMVAHLLTLQESTAGGGDHPVCCALTHPMAAHPTIMTVIDGVVGQQVLNVDLAVGEPPPVPPHTTL
jgi:hypothetical protein